MYLICLFFLTVAASHALKAGDLFTVCHTKDSKFAECVGKTIDDLSPLLKKGIKDLKIPTTEPMFVQEVKVVQGTGPVSIDSTFTNLTVKGVSDYKVSKVSADLDNGVIAYEIEIPHLSIIGDYKIRGRVLILPIVGDGKGYGNFTGVSGVTTMKLKSVVRNGVKYINLEKLSCDSKVKKGNLHLDNLFNGNKELGDAMNKFITLNWEVVFQELKAIIDVAIASIVEDIAKKVFNKFPASEILPD